MRTDDAERCRRARTLGLDPGDDCAVPDDEEFAGTGIPVFGFVELGEARGRELARSLRNRVKRRR